MRYCFLVLSFCIAAASANAQTDITDKVLFDIYKKAGLEGKIKPLIKEPAAQSKLAEDLYVPEVIFAYMDTDSGLTITKDSAVYNLAGLPLVSITQRLNGESGWVNVSMDSVVYLGNNKPASQENFLWKNGGWLSAIKRQMTYNERGLIILLEVEALIQIGTFKYEIRYSYDENDRMTEILYFTIADGQAAPQQRYAFKYNSAGEVAEKLIQISSGAAWENYSLESHIFNENGFEIQGLYQIWKMNGWATYEQYDYVRSPEGYALSQTAKFRVNETLDNSDSLAFTYDERGNTLTEKLSYWDDAAWILMDSVNYAYNETDQLASEEWFSWKNPIWEKWRRRTFAYNAGGNLITQLIEQGNELNSWENFERSVYEYDNAGNRDLGEYFTWMESSWRNSNGFLNLGNRYYSAYLAEARYKLIGPIAVEDENMNPEKFVLAQNFPNPFNPETKINFSLPQSGKASLKIYDMLGREVAELVNGALEKGTHTVSVNGRNLSSGVYIYRLQSGSFTESKKMMLIK